MAVGKAELFVPCCIGCWVLLVDSAETAAASALAAAFCDENYKFTFKKGFKYIMRRIYSRWSINQKSVIYCAA